jgi:hypothetical protein
VAISNSGANAHTVELMIPENSTGYGHYIRQMRRAVTVPAGGTVTVSVFQPPLPIHGPFASVTIDGRVQQEKITIDASNHCEGYRYGNQVSYCLLLSRQIGYDDVNKGLERAFGAKDESPSYMMGTGRGFNSYSLALSERPVSEWSQNWLSYSRFNGVVMTGLEWVSLPPGVRGALLEYVRCGGSVLTVGEAELGEEVSSFGQIRDERFTLNAIGFGTFLTTPSNAMDVWTASDWEALRTNWQPASQSLQSTKDVKEANNWFPVIDDLSIPVRGLLAIVLIFTILIGPVNLYLLSRKKRQIWLLWTVPLLSLTASVIVFGYAALAEGWKGYSRIQSLTILDEQANTATTVGIAAFYCPLTPRDGLHFEYETECTPQVDRNRYGSGSGRTVDWSEDQHFTSGWIASRVPSHFKLRKSQMRREKVLFSGLTTSSPEALNGFGTAIETLYYADADGTVYRADAIDAGAKAALQRVDSSTAMAAGNTAFAKEIFEKDWHFAIGEIIKEPVRYLRPNCYIAIVREPLFVEQAIQKQKSELYESVVYGICQEAANAG